MEPQRPVCPQFRAIRLSKGFMPRAAPGIQGRNADSREIMIDVQIHFWQTPPMGRRAEHSQDQQRRMALDAARAIVVRDGLRALSVRSIAARMSYAAGTLYQLFADLDDLIIVMNCETLEMLGAAASNAPPGSFPVSSCGTDKGRMPRRLAASTPGGIENPARCSRLRGPLTGASTVTTSAR